MNLELKMSFEPLDTNSIREKINKLKDERINKLISEFENQLNIKIHSRFDDLKIEELKELLEKYDRKDEIQDMVEFGTWKQIDKLKELLREYGEYACQNEDEQIEKLKKLVEESSFKDELEKYRILGKMGTNRRIERRIERITEKIQNSKNEDEQIEKLKSVVIEYKHHHSLPTLPKNPHGDLFGIGFIYDEDMDTRVLMAIEMLFAFEMLKGVKNIVAVHEHEGTLAIYSLNPCGYSEIEVFGDNWSIFNFVPENGEWIEVERNYNFS